MPFTIRPCSIETAVQLSIQIPEFRMPYEAAAYRQRFAGKPHLLLAAYDGQLPIGFKAGYEREGYFYSWMGGVLPAYRQRGAAQALADAQEKWAKAQGYESITFKTRNIHRAMLIFALKNGFQIIGMEEKEETSANRIWLRKAL